MPATTLPTIKPNTERQTEPLVTISKQVRFSCAHYYWNSAWSDDKNREVFGACSNRWGHGHDYQLDVAVEGRVHHETFMTMNLKDIKKILVKQVVSQLDHRLLNEQVPYFKTRVPSLENITLYIWYRIKADFEAEGFRLKRIRLQEKPGLFTEYTGQLVKGLDIEAILNDEALPLFGDEKASSRCQSEQETHACCI